MELMFPWAVYAGIATFVVLLIFKLKNKDKFRKGKKVANTGFVEETPLYKSLFKKYKILLHISLLSLLIAILLGYGLLSRPAKVEKTTTVLSNRDIFLCLDISDSMDEVNLAMCEKLMETVENLKGERFGVSIFNAKSITLVPLTTDYKYVIEVLQKLKLAFEINLKIASDPDYDYDDIDYEALYYKYEGTLSYEGSSMIGDGLATCLYSFPDLDEDKERTRLIIFATDNELNGTPHVTIEEAAKLCKKNDVKVFAVTPGYTADEEVFIKAINGTGGKYYNTVKDSNAFEKIIKQIEHTETFEMEKVEIRIYEQPETLFICMLVFIGIYFAISRKVKL